MMYLQLFFAFFKVGAFTFGGGYAMLPLIQSEVTGHGWLSLEEIVNFVAVSEGTPGPFAINVATYVGMETAGILGAVCATAGVVFPSFVIILVIAHCYTRFQNSQIVKGAMNGLRPAVVGLIGSALVSVGAAVFFPMGIQPEAVLRPQFAVECILLLLMLFAGIKKIHPILMIVAAAVIGILCGTFGVIQL